MSDQGPQKRPVKIEVITLSDTDTGEEDMSDRGPLKRPKSDTSEEDMSSHGPLKRPKSEPGKEDLVLIARMADVAPKLTCMQCNGFYRGSVTYCPNKHGLCSTCLPLPNAFTKCPVTGCGKKAIITLDVLPGLVKDLKLPVPCKFKKDGCDQENAEEDVVADHEIECRYRKVPCFQDVCTDQAAVDLETHIFSAHDAAYGKCLDSPGKWFIYKFADTRTVGAQNIWVDPESGLRFRAVLCHNYRERQWVCYTVVFGGRNVAKKFRADMRLSSNDVDASINFNGNLYCLDDWKEWWKEFDASKEFHISDEQFRFHNKGHIKLGDHNKDKNGELMIPITIKIKKKELNA